MPKHVQLRRGTTGQTAVFTGAQGEVTVDTDKKTAVVHDGSTAGGFPLLRELDGFKRTNNLSELSSRSTARDNLDAAWVDDVRRLNAGRRPRGGLHFTGTNLHRVNGPVGSALALGTSDFSIFFVAQARNWTYPAGQIVFYSHSAGNNRFYIHITAAGIIALTFYDNAGSTSTFNFTPDLPLAGGEIYAFLLTVDRDGSATLYINGISDRDKNGATVTANVSAASGINLGSGNTNGYQLGYSFFGVILVPCHGRKSQRCREGVRPRGEIALVSNIREMSPLVWKFGAAIMREPCVRDL